MTLNRLLSTACSFLAIGCLLAAPVALADEIKLHSGERFIGRILDETEEAVRIEIQISPSIIETRTLPRQEIAEIHKQTPAERALEELQTAAAPMDRRSLADYDRLLDQAESFLSVHGDSPQATQARQIAEMLQEERQQVAAGSVKVAGEWYSPLEQTLNFYQFNALVLAEQIREAFENENYLEVMRHYEDLKRTYPLSSHTIEVVPLARQSVERLRTKIDRLILDNPARLARRDQAKLTLPIDQQRRMERAIVDQQNRFDELLLAEQESGIVWRSYNSFHLPSLETTRALLDKAAVELGQQNLAELRESSEKFLKGMELLREARELIDEKRYTEALARVDDAERIDAPENDVKSLRDEIANARTAAEMPPPPARPRPADNTVDELDELAGNPLRNVMRNQHSEAEAERARKEAEEAAEEEATRLQAAARAEEAAREAARLEAEAQEQAMPDSTGTEGEAGGNPIESPIEDPVDETEVVVTPDETTTEPSPETGATVATSGPDAPENDPASATTPTAAAPAEEEADRGFTSVLNLIIMGLAGVMVVLIVVMKVIDLGSARRENARYEQELAEREAATKAEEEEALAAAASDDEALVTAGDGDSEAMSGEVSLEELEAQAAFEEAEEPDAEPAPEPETHTARIPLASPRVEPPVPRP